MARTPEATPAECEAILGPRGELVVTSDNRDTVRKWLTAQGVPSLAARSFTLKELGNIYNDTSNSSLYNIREMARQAERTAPEPTKDAPRPAPETTQTDIEDFAPTNNPPAPKAPREDSATAVGRAVSAAIAAALSQFDAPVDEARIIELIQEHAPQSAPTTTRLEIVQAGEVVRNLSAAHRHEAFADVFTCVQAAPVLLVGPAGSGKTTLAEQTAEALGVPFHFNGALDSPYRLSGFIDAQGRTVRTPFREAFENGGVFLFDEIDGSLPGAVLAFNAALANGRCDFPDGSVERHKDCYIIAAANTYGHGADRVYVGRNQLDAASLDRFAVVDMDYDAKLERAVTGHDEWCDFVQATRGAVRKLGLRHVISPRASIMGAKLLSAGMDRAKVERIALFKGMDADSVRKVREATPEIAPKREAA